MSEPSMKVQQKSLASCSDRISQALVSEGRSATGGESEQGFSGISADGKVEWSIDLSGDVEIRVGDYRVRIYTDGLYLHREMSGEGPWEDARECLRLAEAADGGRRRSSMSEPSMKIDELVKYHEDKLSTYKALKLREIAKQTELNESSSRRINAYSFRVDFHVRALDLLRAIVPKE